MATYVNNLRLKEIATGDEDGTWGTSTNTNLELIGEALGYGTQDCFATDANSTTTVADSASDPARAMYFKVTSSATLTATRELTIGPNTISRVMYIENATTGSQSITIKQGTGGTVTVANGRTSVVYLDGAGVGAAVVDAMANVDPGVTDTLAEVLAAGNTSGANDLVIDSGQVITTNTINETTAAGGVTIDGVLIKDNGITASGGGSLTGTWSDLGTVTTVDINGGTIDGVTIGGAAAAAGSFTTLSSSGGITGTLQTASQPNITSLGTLTTLTVDNITINGAAITSDTGAISFGNENLTTTGTLASGALTVSSDASVTGNATLGNASTDSHTVNGLVNVITGSAASVATKGLQIRFDDGANTGHISASQSGVANYPLYLGADGFGTNALIVDGSGYVGMGTASPTTYGAFAIRRAVTVGGESVSASFSDAVNSTFEIRHRSSTVDLASVQVITISPQGTDNVLSLSSTGATFAGDVTLSEGKVSITDTANETAFSLTSSVTAASASQITTTAQATLQTSSNASLQLSTTQGTTNYGPYMLFSDVSGSVETFGKFGLVYGGSGNNDPEFQWWAYPGGVSYTQLMALNRTDLTLSSGLDFTVVAGDVTLSEGKVSITSTTNEQVMTVTGNSIANNGLALFSSSSTAVNARSLVKIEQTALGGGATGLEIDMSGQPAFNIDGHGSITIDGGVITSDFADVGEAGALVLTNSDGGTSNSSILLVGSQSGGGGNIASVIGFRRESSATWGSAIDFYTHQAAISNIDQMNLVLTLDSSQNATFAGDVTLSGGLLDISGATSGQIKFPATQNASSDANTLDDYEEGTFTATLTGATTAPTVAVTGSGIYTKIGREVTVRFIFNNVDTSGGSGVLRVTGLPFTAANNTESQGACSFSGFGSAPVVVYTRPNQSYAEFYDCVTLGAISMVAGSGKYLSATLTYYV